MLVSHRHRFIFLKTQKTASTSIEIALSAFMGERGDIITPISPEDEKLRRNLSAAGPRNYLASPIEYGVNDVWRLASRLKLKKRFFNHIPAYLAQERLPASIWKEYLIVSIDRHPFDRAISSYYWRTRKMANPPSVNEYVLNAPSKELSNWQIYSIEDNIVAGFMMRYEALTEDLSRLSELLGLSHPIQLPPEKTKGTHRLDRRPWRELLDQSSTRRLRLVCAKEAISLGYDLET